MKKLGKNSKKYCEIVYSWCRFQGVFHALKRKKQHYDIYLRHNAIYHFSICNYNKKYIEVQSFKCKITN